MTALLDRAAGAYADPEPLTSEQLEFFRKQRCERVQGILFSAPLAVERITAMLDSG